MLKASSSAQKKQLSWLEITHWLSRNTFWSCEKTKHKEAESNTIVLVKSYVNQIIWKQKAVEWAKINKKDKFKRFVQYLITE